MAPRYLRPIREVKPKERCCKSGPRCKRCPVVLSRLEKQGLATRKKGKYLLPKGLKKKRLKAVRVR
jgi:hypothetical protein